MNSDEVKSNITRAAGIGLAWAAGRYHLSSDSVGLVMSDVGYVGSAAAFIYGVVQHWNMKKVPETAKVIGGTAMILLALALGFAPAAHAADMTPAYKARALAPAPVTCTVVSCTGWFVGGNLANTGTSLDVIGTGLSGIAQNGLGMGGQAGYEFFSNNIYAAAYVVGDYDVSIQTPAAVTDRFTYGAGVRLGYSLASAFGSGVTSGASLTLPQQFLQSLMTPYIGVEEVKRHNQPAFVTGLGVEALVAADPTGHSSWTLNADLLHYSYNQGGASGTLGALPVSQNGETVVRVALNKHFGF